MVQSDRCQVKMAYTRFKVVVFDKRENNGSKKLGQNRSDRFIKEFWAKKDQPL